MTQNKELSATRLQRADQPGTAYHVVVQRSSFHPAAALAAAARLARGGVEAVSAAIADVYLVGARAVLDRQEAIADGLASRRARFARASVDSLHSPRD